MIFKPRRITRILGVYLGHGPCPVFVQDDFADLNEGQSSDHWNALWHCELHFQNSTFASEEERKQWMDLVNTYTGTRTMNNAPLSLAL